jgi:hypothetical protein
MILLPSGICMKIQSHQTPVKAQEKAERQQKVNLFTQSNQSVTESVYLSPRAQEQHHVQHTADTSGPARQQSHVFVCASEAASPHHPLPDHQHPHPDHPRAMCLSNLIDLADLPCRRNLVDSRSRERNT